MNQPNIEPTSCSLTTEVNGEFGTEVLDAREASKFLKVSVSTLYRHARRDLILNRKFGGQYRFLKQDLIRWLKGELNE